MAVMDKSGRQIFEEFAAQLCEWSKTGKTPAAGNQDIRYALSLQQERLDKCQARAEYILKLRGEWLDRISNTVFASEKYTNKLFWRSYQRTANYYVRDKKCLTLKENENMYAMITWLNHGDMQETYCCPNCGNISEIGVLLEGCPYCKTRFLMSDLFPKVTTYHFLRDYGMNNREGKSTLKKWMIPGAVIVMLLNAPNAFSNLAQSLQNGYSMAGSVLTSLLPLAVFGVFGAIGGYIIWVACTMAKLLKDCFKQVPMAAGITEARKQLTSIMKQFDPGFSYEYFIGSMQALLKILMFTDDRTNLAVYEGTSVGTMFDNIIDAQFEGAVTLNRCWVEGEYCFLDVNVHMTDIYCQGQDVTRKSEKFAMVVCRNKNRPVDYGFSIKKVSCKSCGASFDASKERRCPYCGGSYDLKEDDWVITSITKK